MRNVTEVIAYSSMIRILIDENERLRRENSILRQELKERLVSEWMGYYDMSEERAEENADQYIIHAILHNEGAE